MLMYEGCENIEQRGLSLSAVSGCLFLHLPRQRNKRAETVKGRKRRLLRVAGRERRRGVCQTLFALGFGLAQHRRMSPSDRGSPGRRAYTRGRQSGRRREAT